MQALLQSPSGVGSQHRSMMPSSLVSKRHSRPSPSTSRFGEPEAAKRKSKNVASRGMTRGHDSAGRSQASFCNIHNSEGLRFPKTSSAGNVPCGPSRPLTSTSCKSMGAVVPPTREYGSIARFAACKDLKLPPRSRPGQRANGPRSSGARAGSRHHTPGWRVRTRPRLWLRCAGRPRSRSYYRGHHQRACRWLRGKIGDCRPLHNPRPGFAS